MARITRILTQFDGLRALVACLLACKRNYVQLIAEQIELPYVVLLKRRKIS
jgi:hypothetical protein